MTPNKIVSLGSVAFGNALPLSLIAGPCQMESREHAFMIAGRLKEICGRLGIGLVYKSSFDKANRTSLSGRRGMGLEKSLAVFADIRKELGLTVLTAVHENAQCAEVASVVDVLQIPAFLCRQTRSQFLRLPDRAAAPPPPRRFHSRPGICHFSRSRNELSVIALQRTIGFPSLW